MKPRTVLVPCLGLAAGLAAQTPIDSIVPPKADSIAPVVSVAPTAKDSVATPSVQQPDLAPVAPMTVASSLPSGRGPRWWNALGQDSLPYDSLQKITINMGVTPGSDANGAQPRKVANAFSISLVSAEAGAIRGLQGSGAMNDVEGSVRGVQGTGGLNLVGGNVVGVQGGGVNLVRGNLSGFQYGALFNRVGGDVEGVQFGVVGNLTDGEVRGLQAASVVNRARSVRGVQDGFVNLADRVRGGQGGFVNVADNIKGFQWGFVNIADTMVGPQIGFINIRPDARYFAETWMDETGMGHIGLNYGSPGWYNLIDFGMHRRDPRRLSFGIGFGGRYPSKRLILSLDGTAAMVADPDRLDQDTGTIKLTASSPGELRLEGNPDRIDALNGLFRLRATAGWHLWGRFAVYGGVSGNALVAPHNGHGTKLLTPVGDYHWDATPHTRYWPGFFAGIRI